MTAVAQNAPQPAQSGNPATLVEDLEREVSGLRHALASRAPIEQAKGMLMLRHRIDADQAFQLLREWSSVHNLKLRVVATTLVEVWSTEPDVVHSESASRRVLSTGPGPVPGAADVRGLLMRSGTQPGNASVAS